MEIRIDSFHDLERYWLKLDRIGKMKITSPRTTQDYMKYLKEYWDEGLLFISRKTDFIIIEAEDGILCFNPDGKEIYRDTFSINWELKVMKTILRCHLGQTIRREEKAL